MQLIRIVTKSSLFSLSPYLGKFNSTELTIAEYLSEIYKTLAKEILDKLQDLLLQRWVPSYFSIMHKRKFVFCVGNVSYETKCTGTVARVDNLAIGDPISNHRQMRIESLYFALSENK